MAAHELKTPLTALELQGDGLCRALRGGGEAGLTTERITRFSDRVSRQIERLSLLVNDFLDMSRIRLGGLSLRGEKFDLAELAREDIER